MVPNGSAIEREDVQADLCQADWLSLKFDAVQEDVWRRTPREAARRARTIPDGGSEP